MRRVAFIQIIIFVVVLFSFQLQAREDDSSSALLTVQKLTSLISNHIISDAKVREIASTDKEIFLKYKAENRKHHAEIEKYMDFELLGTLSMPEKWRDKYWKDPNKKKAYMEVLKELIEEVVYPKGKDFFKEVDLSYKKAVELEGSQKVSITCDANIKEKKDKSVQIEYRLVLKDDKWKIYDINLEGDWWSESFKSQFNHIITKNSYADLIQKLRLKLNNVKSGNSF